MINRHARHPEAGATYVPIDPEYPAARREYIMRHAGIGLLLADQASETTIPRWHWTGDPARDYPTGNLDLAIDPTQLAYVIYTSGSTGTTQGRDDRASFGGESIQWVNTRFAVGERDSLLFITSMCFDLSVYDIFGNTRMRRPGGDRRPRADPRSRALLDPDAAEHVTVLGLRASTINHLINTVEEVAPDFRGGDLRWCS